MASTEFFWKTTLHILLNIKPPTGVSEVCFAFQQDSNSLKKCFRFPFQSAGSTLQISNGLSERRAVASHVFSETLTTQFATKQCHHSTYCMLYILLVFYLISEQLQEPPVPAHHSLSMKVILWWVQVLLAQRSPLYRKIQLWRKR